jgi:protein-histidine pros-kinase
MPQSVPAYAATRYVSEFRKNYPEFSYKEATLNPTNPADRAVGWEADVVSWFRDHPDEKELIGERMTPTGRALYMGHPIQITDEKCLVCHSTPAEAPPTLIETYGDDNGFGWKMNEIIGAQIVQVPMSLPLQRARSALITFMGSLIVAFLLVALLLNIMLHKIVIKPVQALSAKADAMSMGTQNVEELEVVGNDEMAALARSFNRMHRSLDSAMKMLDDGTVLRRE